MPESLWHFCASHWGSFAGLRCGNCDTCPINSRGYVLAWPMHNGLASVAIMPSTQNLEVSHDHAEQQSTSQALYASQKGLGKHVEAGTT